MASDLQTVSGRERLKPRREPYYVKLTSGCSLGFRKMTRESTGTWLARSRDAATGMQSKRSLGEFDALPPSQRYDAAKAAAEAWFKHLGMGGTAELITVKQACMAYVDHVRALKGDTPADDIERRYRRWVYPDAKFCQIELTRLTHVHVDRWRKTIASVDVQVNYDDTNPVLRARSASTVNRDMTALRAAFNHAHDCGHVTSDMAWRVALRATKNADRRRDIYLDREQRIALLRQASEELAPLLRGMAQVPLRPGALAALAVGQFDARLGVLTVGRDKAGRDRKMRLPTSTAAFFERLSEGRPATAPLFTRADGKRWTKDDWKKPLKCAAKEAGLPDSTTAYALRHSVITDLVTGGLDLLTVAQLSGTSVAMIERHYGHHRAEHAAAALAGLAL